MRRVKVVGNTTRGLGSDDEPAYGVGFEYDAAGDAEDRLLQVYEFLLGLPGASEIDLGEPEMTCYAPDTIGV